MGPDGIEQHLPWTARDHSFQDIKSLETIPDGERSDSIVHSRIRFSLIATRKTYGAGYCGTVHPSLTGLTLTSHDRCYADGSLAGFGVQVPLN